MTLFRSHFLRKQDKEWKEDKEEEKEEKLSSFEKSSIHFVEDHVKTTLTEIFKLMTGSMTFSPEKEKQLTNTGGAADGKDTFCTLVVRVSEFALCHISLLQKKD